MKPNMTAVTVACWSASWALATASLLAILFNHPAVSVVLFSLAIPALVVGGVRPLGILAWRGLRQALLDAQIDDDAPPTPAREVRHPLHRRR